MESRPPDRLIEFLSNNSINIIWRVVRGVITSFSLNARLWWRKTTLCTKNFEAISLSRSGVLPHFFSASTISSSFVFQYLREDDWIERHEDRSVWDDFRTDNY